VHAAVLMSGVKVGSVSAIDLDPDGKSVTISLRIHKKYSVYKTARFVIEQSGFLGINTWPSAGGQPGPVFEDGGQARAEAPFNLQEVARSASGFVLRVTRPPSASTRPSPTCGAWCSTTRR